ncbi:MAG: hypothetical protein WBA46_09510 [Thermomicrobiales bacterium]
MSDTSSALTTANAREIGLPTGTEWKAMLTMGGDLAGTGFLPAHIKNGAQAAAIMLKGQELRVPPMQALANIVMVQGKPTVSSELMLAIIYRDHGKQALRVKETTAERCTIEYRVEGWDGTSELTFTIDDAKKAGLVKPGPWTSYPAVMLRWRAISQVAKMAFPETIGGMYTPGELGEPVRIDGDNLVVDADAIETSGYVASPPPAPRPIRKDKPAWVKEVEADPYRLSAMRRLHAIGDSHGIDHDMLHAYAVIEGKSGLSQYSNEDLNALSNEIDTDDASVLQGMFGDLGWEAPAWMASRSVDTETGEIIDVTPVAPVDDAKARTAAKRALWNAVKGWGWTLDDLEVYAAHNAGKPLGEMSREEYEGLQAWLDDASPEGRAEELANAREAIGKVA